MPDLREFLEHTFSAAGGTLGFDEFMAAALYDREHGYYLSGIAEVGGRQGDFATSATLSDGLGRAVAHWLGAESEHHGWTGPVHVIEIGAGNGALAATVLKSLGWLGRRRIRYHIVEVSPVLRALQQRRLGRRAAWHDSPTEALKSAGGRALLFSNELIDAFPAKWLRFGSGGWSEIHVSFHRDRGLREEFRPLPADCEAATYSALDLPDPGEGQRIEILPSCRRWFRDWVPYWESGSMLTIDYGGPTAATVYAGRPDGTLRAYFRHERMGGAGVYARFGRQDLTSDVNFADLISWGCELGLKTVALSPQRDFLEARSGGNDPMAGPGPGEAFWVLEQRR